MSFDDPKDKKPDQDIFDVEEYLEERLAELESYEDYHYEEEGDIERRYNNNPIDSYFFDDSGPKSIEPPALKRNKSFVQKVRQCSSKNKDQLEIGIRFFPKLISNMR